VIGGRRALNDTLYSCTLLVRREWKTLAAGLLGTAAFAVVISREAGPNFIETGEIVRFGSYVHELGNRPTVIVRFPDGRMEEVKAFPEALKGWRRGAQVRLVRRDRNLQLAFDACRAS
jgi:hypothetical protein